MDEDLIIEEPRFEEDKVWTERDFDEMGWLDATFHGIAFFPEKDEIALDIDYIFEWIESYRREGYYDFRVAPATLVFENIHNFLFDMGEAYRTLQIKFIERSDLKGLQTLNTSKKTPNGSGRLISNSGTSVFILLVTNSLSGGNHF